MPIVIVGLIIAAWVITSNLPADRGKVARTTTETRDTRIDPAETGTLVPVDENAPEEPPLIAESQPGTVTAAPDTQPAAPANVQVPVVATPPPPQVAVAQPRPTPTPVATPRPPAVVARASQPAQRSVAPAPRPAQPQVVTARPAPQPHPAPARPLPPPQVSSSEPRPTPAPPPDSIPKKDANVRISEPDAIRIMRRFIVSNDYYDTHPDCLSVVSRGYVNVGYTLEAWDTCPSTGGSRRIGVWRVDAISGEVFRQGAGGRFGRP